MNDCDGITGTPIAMGRHATDGHHIEPGFAAFLVGNSARGAAARVIRYPPSGSWASVADALPNCPALAVSAKAGFFEGCSPSGACCRNVFR